jgi:hypothetical protein
MRVVALNYPDDFIKKKFLIAFHNLFKCGLLPTPAKKEYKF